MKIDKYHLNLAGECRVCSELLKRGVYICNGYFLWNRLREVLAKFITGIEAPLSISQTDRFQVTIRPAIGSVKSEKERQKSG
jgi:hypothetical protein